ncbi:MAG: ATP-dependent helicase HrpB [Ilumatobacteraceae bacterium]|nr:ATP-dependent helicase HrpB [Ilumatobacteraceae bacterium]
MTHRLPDLPVLDALPAVLAALAEHGSAILVAPPGAGKTTLAPLVVVNEAWMVGQRIVMLEPRRLATRAAAQRMASLLGEAVGETVGYQTRDERHIGPGTRIEVVTEGVLTRRLQHDPSLEGYGLVIFDEVHERNLPTDVGLALLLDARSSLRPDLRVLAMSATPDTKGLLRVLGDDTPVASSDGRMHPVDIVWAPMGKQDRVQEATAALVQRALREQTGDVLVFLPGVGEIRRVQGLLEGAIPPGIDVYPLAGALSLAEQDRALAPSPAGRRRVVLSTDLAESSLTVDGVRVVVDAGLARVPRFDQRTGMSRLTTVSTSRASADQRAGRAGRTEPGAAYRLWSKLEHGTRRAHLEPEVTQVDLAGLALELAAWGTPVDELRWADAPPPRTLQQAIELLVRLDALTEDGRLTDRGRRMLALPLHPRLARMVAGADTADGSLACVVAALLDERDVFRGRPDELPADLALRVGAVCGQYHERADSRDVRRVRDRAADIARRAQMRFDLDSVRSDRCGVVLALAYPDRVAVRRNQPGQFQLRTGSSAWTPPTAPLANERFVVAADLDGKRDNARIRIGAALDVDDVIASLADQIERRESLVWDKQRDDLVQRVETRLGGMLLDEQVRSAEPGDATTVALVERVRTTRMTALRWSPSAVLLRARVAFLRHHLGADQWPDWSDAALIAALDEWLAPYLVGAIGMADLAALDTSMLLSAQLDWDTSSQLSTLAPTHLDTPAGRTAVIDYSRDVPTASVRVQDLFGLAEHPTVAGNVPVSLELLSPADRPIQITSNLPGFWAGTWADVRKEMAGRYPKHQWPADPANAAPKRLK